jgi:hypothetical protein
MLLGEASVVAMEAARRRKAVDKMTAVFKAESLCGLLDDVGL